MKFRVIAGALIVILLPVPSATAGATANKSKQAAVSLKSQLLAATDIPGGWAVATNSSSSSGSAPPQCFAGLEGATNKSHNPTVTFEKGTDGPEFGETLVAAKGKAIPLLAVLSSALNSCGTISYNSGGQDVKIQISSASLPRIGDRSQAFKLLVSASILSVPGYIIATEHKNNEVGIFTYIALSGNGGTSELVRLAKDAEAKIEGKKSPDYRSGGPFSVGQAAKFDDGQGNTATITLVRVIDPAQGADQYTTPSPGDRFVTAEFKILNTGNSFQPEPTSDATVFDTASHSYSSTYQDVQGCPAFASNLTLTGGETADGCVTFEIPTGSALQKVQYSEQSGGGTAIWTLASTGTTTSSTPTTGG
jgi:hypothetical protein